MAAALVVVSTGEHRYPEIQTITMDPEKGNLLMAAIRKGNFLWRVDGTHDPIPQKATLLSAREAAEEGGDTEFATTYAAYAALADDEKAKIDTFGSCIASPPPCGGRIPTRRTRSGPRGTGCRPREQPLVWRHPDGRSSLVVGSTADHVVGLPEDESDSLLERLLEWATQPQFVLRHQWRRGDLVMWDNTGMLHRALPFEATSRRLLHRTTPVGTVAIA